MHCSVSHSPLIINSRPKLCTPTRNSVLVGCCSGKSSHVDVKRRGLVLGSVFGGGVAFLNGVPSLAVELAPLGDVDRIGGEKMTGLTVDQVKDILEKDVGERKYFITGNLTPEIFADDCRFRDPTNDTIGVNRYVKALRLLFDPENSDVTLKSMEVASANTIKGEWTLEGYLKFPWNPKIEPVNGTVVYTLNADGLVQLQDEEWDVAPWKALLQSFTPRAPPPKKT